MSQVSIVHIISRLNVGGPAVHVAELASGLKDRQFEVTVVTGIPDNAEGDMTASVTTTGVPCCILPSLGRALSPLDDLVSLVMLFRLIRRLRPDIVHTHTAKAGALGRIAAYFARVPVILHTFHGHVFYGYWPSGRSRIVVLLERFLAQLTTAIVTVSDNIRRDLMKFGVAPLDKVHVLPLGINLDQYINCASRRGEFRAELGIPQHIPLVGIVGRLVPIKNPNLFLQTAYHMLSNGFDGCFVVVGGGELALTLTHTAGELDIANRVYFVGWRSDLDRVYADLDVIVNTSSNEGTPVSLMEAMAARVPVVAMAVGGVPDMITPENTGYLVPSNGDVEALETAIHQALSTPESLLDAAQKSVLERHSVVPMLTRISDLYHMLLAG